MDGPSSDARATTSLALRVLDRLESQGLAGWDPYDALNARRIPAFVTSTVRGRQVVTQLLKRSPNALRRMLGVPKAVSAYTLGHVLVAYARLHSAGLLADAQERAAEVLRQIREAALPGWSGACWGYHFDVQTRFLFYDRRTPNAIVTAFVAKGLAEATRAGLVDGRDLISGACAFMMGDLALTDASGERCFQYTPNPSSLVHNATALCAQTLVYGASLAGESTLDDALSAARCVVSYQRGDGAWPYSVQENGQWVDGFHTGFVLEGVHAVAEATGDAGLRASLEAGMRYYVSNLFDEDGAPRYYDTHALPYDALSAAQGIEVLTTLSDLDERAEDVCARLVGWTTKHLVDASGRVAYRRGRFTTDRREFPRWSGAPLCSALSARVGAVSDR